jgi:Tol biopolymer transport system component
LLGFFSQGKLKTIEIGGGQPRTLTDSALDSRGGTWGPDDTILFAPSANSCIFRIPARTTGTASQVTKFDASRADNSHRFPAFLPDGRHFLYTTRSTRQEHWGISMASLDSPVGTPLIDRTDWSAQFAPPGYILFVRDGTLMAQPFDLDRLATKGDAVPVAVDVGTTTTSYAAFSVSHNGVIVHAKNIGLLGELRWFDRSGSPAGSVGTLADYIDFELSPNERTVVVSRLDPKLKSADIYLLDLARNVFEPVTKDPRHDASALWSPDGTRIVFRSNRRGYTELYQKRPSGTEPEQIVLNAGTNVITSDWSLDGKSIVYTKTSLTGGFDIWVWPVHGDAKPQSAVDTGLNAMHGRLSPNGRWLAYASDEFGQLQVYVQPFPATGEKRQISSDGGSEPRWRRDGNELFYLASSNKLMSVQIPGGNAFDFGVPKVLFDTHVPLMGNPYRSNYAVTANGQRFLVNTRLEDTPSSISIIHNWTALLKK